ncbi:uncharacterized protein N7483_008150 [Penicillium malachiteum]|uniref:uncharacterized protein n=1 Tax=Penicillium malachiteum TaxID=1324776 RepID=UPI0025488138|nr:uncharacterized protein N7483_008150 [Penicillium malachiteum]KAJ5720216.1 hypothetical protein N7483_008150 [Penicillium malachiteum]
MDETWDTTPAEAAVVGTNGEAYRPRGYQLEMLEASLQQNIIVALRIELLLTCIEQLVWFLAPTVALCVQQHEVISSQIPAVKTRTLTGMDNVDRWTEQSVWDKVLEDVRVVVSTHAVLSDALNHGFVRISGLSLLVFDEAHHCMRRHPANKIMQYHYHPTKEKLGPKSVPRILGLTASPIVRSSRQELETELIFHVHRPHLERIQYPAYDPEQQGAGSRLLTRLFSCIRSYDMRYDPYIEMLRKRPETEEQADKATVSGKTFCLEQLTKFREQCIHIYEELGGWATDYYIEACTAQLERSVGIVAGMTQLACEEKAYVLKLLSAILVDGKTHQTFHISSKLETLLSFLDKHDNPNFSGLIFVKRRATVSVLSQILTNHLTTKDRFRCAAYVGWSGSVSRKDSLGDLLTRQAQKDTLSLFKSGAKNLIVSTDVLEEGLDVSSCSLVICYDKPANLKSFVQRRGRARHQESTYVILTSSDDELLDLEKWQSLEQAMVESYQDDERKLHDASGQEEAVSEWLKVDKTGARLSADDAIAHLNHFCDTLPTNKFADKHAMFTFQENSDRLIQGTVTLPNSVDPAVRRAQGKKWWKTERAARKEAAFQAYKALLEHGLVNDNLLPLLIEEQQIPSVKKKDHGGVIEDLEGQYDPFKDFAKLWEAPDLHQTDIIFTHNGYVYEDFSMSLILPCFTIMPGPTPMYWNSNTTLIASFTTPRRIDPVSPEMLQLMREVTGMFMQGRSSNIPNSERDYVALFIPRIPFDELQEWTCRNEGIESALAYYAREKTIPPAGIIRNTAKYNKTHLFRTWIVSENDGNVQIDIECEATPQRRNFLNPRTKAEADEDGQPTQAKISIVPAKDCTLARLPARKALFGLLISAILDRIEVVLVAQRLKDSFLSPLNFKNLGHIITAITTPLAQARTDYQVYEFFGDSILKFTVSVHLFWQNPTWPEGYLSSNRDKIVKNKRLADAARSAKLESFILNKRFTPGRWEAPLIAQKLAKSADKQTLSSKVLADIVESLIGAAFMDGGMSKAQDCVQLFLPEVEFLSRHITNVNLSSTTRGSSKLIDQNVLANAIGYTFKDTSLLTEALTHPSCEHDVTTQSYQRLEYLGDSVLDMVLVSILISHCEKTLTQGQMTIIKHALVNANLLAYLCMSHHVPGVAVDEMETDKEEAKVGLSQSASIWQFLRFNGQPITIAIQGCIARYNVMRDQIAESITSADFYPWQPLATMHPDKFMSDIVESILGAIYVDSEGDLAACQVFLERIGLIAYLQRVLKEGINMVHPRNAAQALVKNEGIIAFKIKRVENAGSDATYSGDLVFHKNPTENQPREVQHLLEISGCVSAEEVEVQLSYEFIQRKMASASSSQENTGEN